jgi:hypothetical protein
VWLLNEEGTCEAKVLPLAWLDVYVMPDYAIVSYELKGCDGTGWAPIAVAGEEAPARSLGWVRAVGVENSEQREPATSLQAPASPWTRQLAELAKQQPGGVQRLELRRAVFERSTVVEATFGVTWPAHPECESNFEQRMMLGLMQGDTFTSVPCRNCRWHWLQGAITENGQPVVIVVMDEAAKLHLLAPPESPWRAFDLPPVRTVWFGEGELSRRLVEPCHSL